MIGMAIQIRNQINPIILGPEFECEIRNYITDSALYLSISLTKVTPNKKRIFNIQHF